MSQVDASVLARYTIRPRLMSVPGVANVVMWGQQDRQLQVAVDPKKLAAADVSVDQVVQSAGNAMWVSPLSYLEASAPGSGGFIDTANQRLGIQHVSPIVSPDTRPGHPRGHAEPGREAERRRHHQRRPRPAHR